MHKYLHIQLSNSVTDTTVPYFHVLKQIETWVSATVNG